MQNSQSDRRNCRRRCHRVPAARRGASARWPFFERSERGGNLALFYARRGLGLRLACSYRSEYSNSLGGEPETDVCMDEHGQLDFKASYDLGEKVAMYLQAQNLTAEPLRYLSGTDRLLAENESYSWKAMSGLEVES